MKNVLEVLNQMWDAFAAGPYTAVPLSGGTMTGPLVVKKYIQANTFSGNSIIGTGSSATWFRLGRLSGVAPSSGGMTITGVSGYSSGGTASASAGSTHIFFRVENDGVIRGHFYSETSGSAAVIEVIVDSNKDLYVSVGSFFNGAVLAYGQLDFTPDQINYGTTAPVGQSLLSKRTVVLGVTRALAITPTTITTPCEFVGTRLLPATDNAHSVGSASAAYSTIYARTGTINTSDVRFKRDFRDLTTAEIAAARDLARAIGVYRWRDAVESKGDGAREHIGPTVQRAIEIMEAHGLDPFNYGFICLDAWEQQTVEHPAIEARPAMPATEAAPEVLDSLGNVITPAVPASPGFPAIEARAAYTEVTLEAGDRYAFRYDELAMFIAAGHEARLAALEAA